MSDFILLNQGTLKNWRLEESPEAFEFARQYMMLKFSPSSMVQIGHDTPAQKDLICKMIDAVNGSVQNYWTGEIYNNKEDAKYCVMDYGSY